MLSFVGCCNTGFVLVALVVVAFRRNLFLWLFWGGGLVFLCGLPAWVCGVALGGVCWFWFGYLGGFGGWGVTVGLGVMVMA